VADSATAVAGLGLPGCVSSSTSRPYPQQVHNSSSVVPQRYKDPTPYGVKTGVKPSTAYALNAAAQALHHYANARGPYSQLASELHQQLRWALLRNLVGQYSRTGYIWEQYDDASGAGKGSHPFTGWSALLVLMAAEQ